MFIMNRFFNVSIRYIYLHRPLDSLVVKFGEAKIYRWGVLALLASLKYVHVGRN